MSENSTNLKKRLSEKICICLLILWGGLGAHYILGIGRGGIDTGGFSFNVESVSQMIPIALVITLCVVSWLLWFPFADMADEPELTFTTAFKNHLKSGIGISLIITWFVFVILPFISLRF